MCQASAVTIAGQAKKPTFPKETRHFGYFSYLVPILRHLKKAVFTKYWSSTLWKPEFFKGMQKGRHPKSLVTLENLGQHFQKCPFIWDASFFGNSSDTLSLLFRSTELLLLFNRSCGAQPFWKNQTPGASMKCQKHSRRYVAGHQFSTFPRNHHQVSSWL